MSADLSGGLLNLSREELEAAKRYCKAPDEDEYIVMECFLGARVYMAGAGVSLPPPQTERRAIYDLVCHGLTLGSYDHRDPIIAKTGKPIAENPQLRRYLNQLKMTEPPVSKLDTGAQGGQ